MPILNYTSKVGVTITVGRITQLLAQQGCTKVTTVFELGKAVGMTFEIELLGYQLHYRLPVNIAGVGRAMKAHPRVGMAYCNQEQYERVAWRIAQDYIEALLAIVEAGQAELAEVFLPYALDQQNRTLFENLKAGNLPLLSA